MPLRLEIKRKLSARSERVKCNDFHPTEPWILAALYSGHVFIWNYTTQTMVKSIEVCDLPVRTAKFIPAKQWIICGSDDMQIRIYNYNTMERVRTFEAHTDYIRSLAIHPTLPYVLSSSDDMLIKLWDWDKGWECLQVFEGHTHYVMQVEFNPKDTNTFASASLDRTVKVWGLNSPNPHFSLEGHERGVNCIGYFRGGDRPYLVSGADDHLIKIWDYQTKSCVATLDGHTNNVSAVCFHPQLPIILSGSEDGTVRIWHSNTYRLENTLNYGMERVWTISCLKGSNKVAIGYDDGTIMIKLGHEEPVVSMERGGKVVWAKNHEIVIANIRSAGEEVQDGERVQVQTKDLGSCEIYPQSLSHDPKGRLLCVCGDGEYIVYTALALRNKSFGPALEFVWANDSGSYATRESSSKIKIFKDFKEHKQFRPTFAAEGIFGGALLGIRSNDFIDLYDWAECRVIRRIDVCPRKVFWSESGDVIILACDSSFYVLRYNRDLVNKYFDQGVEIGEQGIEGAFDLEQEVAEKVRNGHFVGDCFIYTNTAGRLNYYVGGEVMTLAHLGKAMYLLGYLPKENRVYLMDKAHNIYTYSLLVSVLVYQTAIVRRDLDAARNALKNIPVEHHNRIARFLEAQDLKEMALEVSTDPEHKFELAMQCKKLKLAHDILLESESEQKWKQLGDAALNLDFDLKLAEECYTRSHDLGGLLLLYTSMGDVQGIEKLIKLAQSSGHHNVAFVGLFLLHRIEDCVQLLCSTDRIPEAAFLTRTYLPSHISRILALWKANLAQVSVKAAEALADPHDYEEKFPDLKWGVKAEEWVAANKRTLHPATDYAKLRAELSRNYIQELKDGLIQEVRAGDKPKPVASTPAPAAVTATPTPAPAKPVTATHPPTPTAAPATSAAPFTHPAQAVTPAAASALAAAAAKPTPAPATATATPAATPVKPAAAAPAPTPATQTPAPWPAVPAATAAPKPAVSTPAPASAPAPAPAAVPKAAESKAPEPAKPAAAPTPAPAKSADPLDDFDDFGDDLDEVDPFADIAPAKPAAAAAATPAKAATLPTKPAETKAPEPAKPAAVAAAAPTPAKPAAAAPPSFDDFGMDDDDTSVSVPSIDDINRKLQALDNSDDDEI